MNRQPCPHCGTALLQERIDGLCAGCGQPLPEHLRPDPVSLCVAAILPSGHILHRLSESASRARIDAMTNRLKAAGFREAAEGQDLSPGLFRCTEEKDVPIVYGIFQLEWIDSDLESGPPEATQASRSPAAPR
jgi:hypothetical protein